MYSVDGQDEVLELSDLPQSSVGAPIPTVVAGEHSVVLFFFCQSVDPNWDGRSVRVIGPDSKDGPSAIVTFLSCYAHFFGPPNDEAFSGHPLYERGLKPYGNFEVRNSSWIRHLEKMNSVHRQHNRERFLERKRHLIFAFHDSTFECIAERYTVERSSQSMRELVSRVGPKILV